jgi:chromosome segregation ATPase
MQRYKEIVAFGILSGSMFLLAGCTKMGRPFDTALKPANAGQKTDTATLKRFQDTNSDGPTAVDSAIELSKKYAALSDETAKLQLERQNLISENSRLKQRIAAMEPELDQTKKELAQANDLLVEMRIELNNWKTDVLGFRDEMRQADKVQLETLVKILETLGGEIKKVSPEKSSAAGTSK